MRNPIRRLSLAVAAKLTIGKLPVSAQGASPVSPDLATFLADSKQRYLTHIRENTSKMDEWTVVMGNEAGDLDSLASSIAFAWIQSEVHKKPTIPLIQTQREDLALRAENQFALELAGLTSPSEQLLFLNDISEFQPLPTHRFALVDHNRLGTPFSTDPDATVVAVVDHHEDEGLYPNANPRIIAPCGSCASHVAALCPSEVPAELATLLLTAILIDTNGLKPGGKAVTTDIHAAGFLAARSTISSKLPTKLVALLIDDPASTGKPDALYEAAAIRELTAALAGKKEDVGHLGARDLLRRDYKEYTYTLEWADDRPAVKAGLSSVPVSLEAWGLSISKEKGKKEKKDKNKDKKEEKEREKEREDEVEEAVVAWMKEREIGVLGVLTSFRDGSKPGKSGRGKHKREMAWVVYDAASTSSAGDDASLHVKLATRLWKGLEDSADIKVKKHKKIDLEKGNKLPPGATSRVYNQGNVAATRKVTAPLLKNILEAPSPTAAGKNEKK
ncbi:putative exopolyphosphatase [Hypsizygus marmoreus]|uniref:Exopolyphosphatase n=1 Tax=Hypsizygus marmoreus TaxID=39966 RepID=A0A369JC72_HYPMA|nr:putative exopolyphosphatase [Hypsizygus marmoreus]